MAEQFNMDLMDDGPVIVSIGSLEEGYQFFGPFDRSEDAEKFIKEVVSSKLKADWHYLSEPYTNSASLAVLDGEIVGEEEIEKVDLPPEVAIINAKGKLIGVQTVISN